MKTLLVSVLFCCASLMFGQFYSHADTAKISNLEVNSLRGNIEQGRSFLADLASSKKSIQRLRREFRHVARFPKIRYGKKYNVRKFYSTRNLSQADDSLISAELHRRYLAIINGHYNLVFVRVRDSTFYVGDEKVPEAHDNIGYYSRINENFEKDVETDEILEYPKSLFQPPHGEVMINSLFYDSITSEFLATPVHEFSHLSTDMNAFISNETIKILSSIAIPDTRNRPKIKNLRTGTIYAYRDNPSEIKARLDNLRYLLYEARIYDARNESFKKKHLKILLQNQTIQKDCNVYDLLNFITKRNKDLIWMMNNIQ